MAGRLTRIEKIANSQLDSLHVKMVPRGIPYFIDGLLRGKMRFGKRTGNSNAVMNPDNTFAIAEDVLAGQRYVNIVTATPWIDLDAIVSIGPNREIAKVDDVVDKRVVFDRVLKFDYAAGKEILLYASPMKPNGSLSSGSTTIQVQSRYPLANGDIFVYLATDGILQSATEIKIKKALLAGTSADPIFTTVYTLELEGEIKRDVPVEELVYFRAFPAYFSNAIRVPNQFNSSVDMGPFLIDFLSGRIVEGFSPKETFSIKLKDRAGNYRFGNSLEYMQVKKNFPILNRPINARSFIFFANSAGDTRITPNRIVMEPIDHKYRITDKLVPAIDFNNQEYRFTTSSNTTGKLILYFEPGTTIVLPIITGNQSHAIQIPAGEKYQMDIVFSSDTPVGRVSMTDWTQVGPQIDVIEYSIVANATGRGTYQTTGISLKPYFLTPEILAGRYDTGDSYDSGFVYF
jgi:hypothetical protein